MKTVYIRIISHSKDQVSSWLLVGVTVAVNDSPTYSGLLDAKFGTSVAAVIADDRIWIIL